MLPDRGQTIICKNTDLLSIEPSETNFSENEYQWSRLFSVRKCFPHFWSFVRGKPPVDSPHKQPTGQASDVFLDVSLTKLLNKQPSQWWFAKSWCSCDVVNSFWPSDIKCWHRSVSILAQIMASCSMKAPSHYLCQFWQITGETLWHSPGDNITEHAGYLSLVWVFFWLQSREKWVNVIMV